MNNNKKLKLNDFIKRLNKILSKKLYIKLGICFFLIIFSGISEAFLIGAVFPFVHSIISKDSPISEEFPTFVNSLNNSNITIVFLIAVLIATVIRVINIKYISYIACLIGNEIAKKSYSNLLKLDYIQLNKLSTSAIINIFISNLNDTVETINLLLVSLNNIIVFIFIISSLLVINTKITLTIGILFFTIYYLLILKQSNSLRASSKEINVSQILASKALQETKELIKQIKLSSKDKSFYTKFSSLSYSVRRNRANYLFITSFPKYAIEGLLLIIIISLLGIMSANTSMDVANILPLFGMFVFAAQRLLPLGQIIYSTRSVFLYYSEPINNILEFVEKKPKYLNKYLNFKKSSASKFEFSKFINLKNIYFRYEAKPYLINNLNLQIPKGQIIGISTPTGSGKSTLINIIMGFAIPEKGTICIDDINIHENNKDFKIQDWWSSISYVPQKIFLSNTSIKNNIAFEFNEENVDFNKVIECSHIAQCQKYILDFPNKYDEILLENASNLSGGQIQRIGIARALYHNPKVLILDEATNALDKLTERKILNAIKDIYKEITIIIISHDNSTLAYCDRVINTINNS